MFGVNSRKSRGLQPKVHPVFLLHLESYCASTASGHSLLRVVGVGWAVSLVDLTQDKRNNGDVFAFNCSITFALMSRSVRMIRSDLTPCVVPKPIPSCSQVSLPPPPSALHLFFLLTFSAFAPSSLDLVVQFSPAPESPGQLQTIQLISTSHPHPSMTLVVAGDSADRSVFPHGLLCKLLTGVIYT